MNALDTNNFLHRLHRIIYNNESINYMNSLQLSKKAQEKINILQKKTIGNWLFAGIQSNSSIFKSPLHLTKEEKKIFIFSDKNLILELESPLDLIESLREKLSIPVFMKNNNKLFLACELIQDESLKKKYNIPNDIQTIKQNKYGIFIPSNQKHPERSEKDITNISIRNINKNSLQNDQKINNTNNHATVPLVQLFDKYFGLHLLFILQQVLKQPLDKTIDISKNFCTKQNKHSNNRVKKDKKKYTGHQIAFLIGDHTESFTIWIPKKQSKNNNQKNTQESTENYQHFLIEGYLPVFGQIQFDITTRKKELFLIIESEKSFDDQTKNGINLLFDQSLSELQWTGQLKYQIFKK